MSTEETDKITTLLKRAAQIPETLNKVKGNIAETNNAIDVLEKSIGDLEAESEQLRVRVLRLVERRLKALEGT